MTELTAHGLCVDRGGCRVLEDVTLALSRGMYLLFLAATELASRLLCRRFWDSFRRPAVMPMFKG